MGNILVTFLVAGTKYLTPTTQRRRRLFWIMFQFVVSRFKAGRHGGRIWQRKVAHFIVVRKPTE